MSEITEDVKQAEDTSDNTDGLTTWVNEPSVIDLKKDYDDAKPDRDAHVLKVETWLDNLNIDGNAKAENEDGKSEVVPKLIRKQAEWRYAALSEPFLSTKDIFNTAPVTAEDKDAATQNGLILNNQFNTKLDKVKLVDESVRTVVDEGTIIWRTGWVFEEEEQDVEVPVFETKPIDDPAIAQALIQQGKEPTAKIQTGVRIEKQMVTTTNEPTVDICDYDKLTIDPSAGGDINSANFVVYDFQTSISALEKEGKYTNLDDIELTEASPLDSSDYGSDDDSDFNFDDKPRQLFMAHEYWGFWDIHNTGELIPIVAAWAGNTMIRMELNPLPDQELPFVVAQYLPVRGEMYGEPDGVLLEDNQRIIGAVTRGMIDIMARSASGQKGSRKDALDTTNRRKYQDGEDYEYNAQVNPQDAFYDHVFPEIPNSAMLMINMQNADAESLTGVKSFSSGISGEALGSTATGVRSALDATSKRELGILRRLAEGFKQLGRKITSMNSEFLEDEEVVRITNSEFVTVRKDNLNGDIDIDLSISTAEADNDKASELAFMLQTMGNNVDFGITKIILSDIATLRNMPELSLKIDEFQPQPDPVQQQMQALQIQLLEAQIRNENAKAAENAVDVDLKKAKTSTEEAKAKNLNSTSDKIDLDFLEQQKGVTQGRKMQEKDHDRSTQLDLKAADKVFADKADNSSEVTPVAQSI